MVLRIEYILIIILAILFFSIMGINPSSQSAIKSTGDREILFENFALFEVKENELGKRIFSSKTTKYATYLDLKDINLSDENGHNIIAGEAIYKDNMIFMDKNITLSADNGLIFSTKNLNYNLKEKVVKSTTPFTLDFNGSKIKGENLEYSMMSKDISADNIHAKILFISNLE